ncbi:MAG TPA: hypothetical protein VIY48_19735 [Candidatus Paceibacterota bacterium]
MSDQVQVYIDREVYDRLQMLMVPPISDANAVIKELLYHDGRASAAAIDMESAAQHYTFAQEIERALQGYYDSGGNT